jgi:hypothetical protein
MLLGEVITIARYIYNNQVITVWARSDPLPPAFLGSADGFRREVFCMAQPAYMRLLMIRIAISLAAYQPIASTISGGASN